MARPDEKLEGGAWAVQYELGALVDCYRRLLKAEHDRDAAIGQNAYLEAMLVHARCVIEFIAKPTEKGEPRDKGLIHRYDYLDGWEVSDAAEYDRLRACELFGKISKHLSHLSWARARTGQPNPRWPYELPGRVVKLFKEFAVDVRKAHGEKPWTEIFENGIRYIETELRAAPPRRTGDGARTSGALMVARNTEVRPR
jgi:hypothetical protein